MGALNVQGLLTILTLENGSPAQDMKPIQEKLKLWEKLLKQKVLVLNWSVKLDWVFWKMDYNARSLPTSSLLLFENICFL